MTRAALAALLLAGCASAPVETPLPTPGAAVDDGALVQTYSQQQQAMLDELQHPSAEAKPADCTRVCELDGNICATSSRLCAVSARHDGETEMESACNDAIDRCSRARVRATTASCTCAALGGTSP